jgi:hypothetical protein
MHFRGEIESRVRARAYEFDEVWLGEALEIATFGELSQLLEVYTWTSRYVPRTPLSRDSGLLGTPGGDVPLGHWTIQDGLRALFLLSRAEVTADPEAFAADAIACYEQGDTGEQASWLRGLCLLPRCEAFLLTAIDACRTNILPLFEAIACENPYPAGYFPELSFNQLVLKSLFKGVALERIIGLPSRLNPELSRMARDYARERLVAGRPVPADISLVTVRGCDGAAVHEYEGAKVRGCESRSRMQEQPR